MKFAVTVSLVLLCSSAMAQQLQQPYAGLQSRVVKSLSEQEIQDLNAGRGMGLALAAELNGYPGPSHAVELSARLGLSPEKVSRLQELFSAMKAETIPIGTDLISQERLLNEAFASHAITLASLESSTRQIGETQGRLRAAHLKYHLSTVAILSPEQIRRYNEFRGYGSGTASGHQHQMNK